MSYTELAPGCRSAASPCNHQKYNPESLCQHCGGVEDMIQRMLPKSDNVGGRPKAQRIPLSGDDYFRLLGAFGERARCMYRLKQALDRAAHHRNHIPQRFKWKWKQADAVCAPLRELMRVYQQELDEMRDAVNWESKHGHH